MVHGLSDRRRVELLAEVYFHLGVISISMLMLSSSLVSMDVHSHLVEY
jgi:hypothetical protein